MPSFGSLCVCFFYSLLFLSDNSSPEKLQFPALKSLRLSQFSTYRHRTGFIAKRKQVRIQEYLEIPINVVIFFFFFFKVAYFAPKNTSFQKNS